MDEQKPLLFPDVKQEKPTEPAATSKPLYLRLPRTMPRYQGPPPAKIMRTAGPLRTTGEPHRLYRSTANEPSTSSDFFRQYSSVDRYNEDVAIRFLFGNGQPLTKIEDPHMREFLSLLNHQRPPPAVGNMKTKVFSENRPILDYNRNIGPMSVTIEAIRKMDEVFLIISVHYYRTDGERHNSVHFEKIILADYEGRVVADRLRRVVDPKKNLTTQISNIVSPNIRMVQLLGENTRFRNKFICFFSYLSNIARDVIQIPEFLPSLNSIRDYVEAIRKHPEVHIKFRRMQMTTDNPIDIPAVEATHDWLSTLNFLTTCSTLHDTFSNLHERWCMPEYLNAAQENSLANLFDFLTVLCHVATEICSEESSVSQVLYSMSVVNNAIENVGLRMARVKIRKIFAKYFNSLSTGRIGDFYSIAALLDPRYGYSAMIFAAEDWTNVEKKLTKEDENLAFELEAYKSVMLDERPDLDESSPQKWWFSQRTGFPQLHKRWIEYSVTPAVSIDGKRLFAKGGKLAHLFATLDEEMHLKAMLLAQNSQSFVGRGNQSLMLSAQLRDVPCEFRRLDDETDTEETGDDEAEEDADEKPSLDSLLEVKQEVVEEGDEEPLDASVDPKKEVEIKVEEPDV